ncbi:MAG: peptidoglycan-N-acetylglucosamine deacetylase, partial [Solirubrobacteraceae bacterium]|nr:peptidoglycan-N-acetylglucosamine deacetylase [Solirubrobacteraceae bacterium]
MGRAVVAAPAVAAAIVALVGLLGDGPGAAPHSARSATAAAPGTPPLVRKVDTGPGPPALVAAGRREVATPKAFDRRGATFLTVQGPLAVVSNAPTSPGKVALTFDDGPGPLTRAFLQRLRRLHVKATFFVVGYAVRRRPHLLREIHTAGMTIGNHSWTHPPMRALPAKAQRLEITANEDAIQSVVGYRPLFFRPPYKSFNLVTAREIAAAGMIGALYTIDTRDWTRPGVRAIVRSALRVKPGGVIAMHDFGV